MKNSLKAVCGTVCLLSSLGESEGMIQRSRSVNNLSSRDRHHLSIFKDMASELGCHDDSIIITLVKIDKALNTETSITNTERVIKYWNEIQQGIDQLFGQPSIALQFIKYGMNMAMKYPGLIKDQYVSPIFFDYLLSSAFGKQKEIANAIRWLNWVNSQYNPVQFTQCLNKVIQKNNLMNTQLNQGNLSLQRLLKILRQQDNLIKWAWQMNEFFCSREDLLRFSLTYQLQMQQLENQEETASYSRNASAAQ